MAEYYVKYKSADDADKIRAFRENVEKNGKSTRIRYPSLRSPTNNTAGNTGGTIVSESLSKFAPHAVIKVKDGEGFASDLASNPNSLTEKHPEIVQYVEPNGEMKTQ